MLAHVACTHLQPDQAVDIQIGLLRVLTVLASRGEDAARWILNNAKLGAALLLPADHATSPDLRDAAQALLVALAPTVRVPRMVCDRRCVCRLVFDVVYVPR